ncbi:MAG: type II toxin-antitoxin system RelE/ParE family toxin [Pseudonocardiaceae bacterium]|nr:type II toxin-antitoxin system RelE/ParE family toxin [Pseudonocardiaceae bacterium]
MGRLVGNEPCASPGQPRGSFTELLETSDLPTERREAALRRRLQAAIDRLAEEPRPAGVVALRSRPGHLRLRVGDWRVVYRVEDDTLVVIVVDLGHRRETYQH